MKGALYHYTGTVTKTVFAGFVFHNSGDLISELHLMQLSSLHFSHGSRVWTAVKFWHEQRLRRGMHHCDPHKYKQDSCHQTLFVHLIKRKGNFPWVTGQKRKYSRGREALPFIYCQATLDKLYLLSALKMHFLWGFHFCWTSQTADKCHELNLDMTAMNSIHLCCTNPHNTATT